MSRREGGETVGDRIEEVRKLTPPPKGRMARKDYASKEDFAEVLGVSRAAVYNWTRKEDPSYPEEPARRALSRASRGRYTPEDFEKPRVQGKGSLDLRVERLERVVAALEQRIFGEGALPS